MALDEAFGLKGFEDSTGLFFGDPEQGCDLGRASWPSQGTVITLKVNKGQNADFCGIQSAHLYVLVELPIESNESHFVPLQQVG